MVIELYPEPEVQQLPLDISTFLDPVFIEGDAFDLVKDIGSNSIQLTVTSPPYNIGKAYETKTNLPDYIQSYEQFIKELFRITSDQGHVVWQVGNYVNDGEVFPLDIYTNRARKPRDL